jgi:hypothetical protein
MKTHFRFNPVATLVLSVTFALIFSPLVASARNLSELSTPMFATLAADQAGNYLLGQKAILTAHINILPSNPSYTLYFESSLGGEKAQITSISPTQAVTVSPSFDRLGPIDWEVDVYLVDTSIYSEIRDSLAFYEDEICALQVKIANETDPDKLVLERSQLARDQSIQAVEQGRLLSARRLVEVDHLTVHVSANRWGSLEDSSLDNPLMTVTADPLYLEYHVGQATHALMHVNQTLSGPDGVRENVVRATLDGQPISVKSSGLSDFYCDTAAWTVAGVGQHLINASLLVRSFAQSNSLREGVGLAETRRANLIRLRDLESDPMKKAGYVSQIQDLTRLITAYYNQLEAILTPMESDQLGFTVVNP